MFTKLLFDELNRQKICYAVLRNYQQLPDSCGGSDLDIWVAKNDAIRVIKTLQSVARNMKSLLVSYTPDNDCPKICYLNTEGGIQIDLFISNIVCKGQIMIREEQIKDNLRDFNGVTVLEQHCGD